MSKIATRIHNVRNISVTRAPIKDWHTLDFVFTDSDGVKFTVEAFIREGECPLELIGDVRLQTTVEVE